MGTAAAGQSCFLSAAGQGAGSCQHKARVRSVGWEAGTGQALAACTPPSSCPLPHQGHPSLTVVAPELWLQPGRMSAHFLPMPSPLPPHLFQLAPENTLMSLQKAVDCDVQVFETDVMVR